MSADPALARFALLRPHVEDGVPLTAVARGADVPIGTMRHWLRRYRRHGLSGLDRKPRADAGSRRCVDPQIVTLIEGLALEVPRRSIAGIHRNVATLLRQDGVKPPCYATVRDIVKAMDPAMMVLARDGAKAYSERFELLHRREAESANAVWQADHTLLDIVVQDDTDAPVRPWLSVIIDDYSRAIMAFRLSLAAPSALQTALVLRDAIWRKADPAWPVCGVPAVLYTDHGSDFTSRHIERVCAELKIRLVFSLPGRPRGRGRVERVFSTFNQRVLSELPGYLQAGTAQPKASITMPELELALRTFILGTYHHTLHSGTGVPPVVRWSADGFLPRMPESLEALDLLLLTVARARQVHRDGVRLNGLRYISPDLAAYVGEAVTVRFDPADMAELRIYHRDRFLCRAICTELAGDTVSLTDIVRARRARQRDLAQAIKDRRGLVDALLDRPGKNAGKSLLPAESALEQPPAHGLRTYASD